MRLALILRALKLRKPEPPARDWLVLAWPAILTAALAGCGSITAEGVLDAQEACKQFGGLQSISPTATSSSAYEASCRDGKTITGMARK